MKPTAISTIVVTKCGQTVPSSHASTKRWPTVSGAGRMNGGRPVRTTIAFQTRTKTTKAPTTGSQVERLTTTSSAETPGRVAVSASAAAGRSCCLGVAEVGPDLAPGAGGGRLVEVGDRPRPRQWSTGMSATTRPGRGDRTTTRSAIRIASGMLWVTITMVVAARSQSRSSSRSKRSRLSASSALNGSSSRRTAGSSASARASATRWAVPPDSSDGRESATAGSRPTRSISVGEARGAALGGPAGELERIGDVVGGRAPRQQARLLEDQPDARVGAGDRRVRRAGPRRWPGRAGRR